ncbi:GAF domain-like protein [Chytridium lagenaria]|nr:GAF domain-like protein [Chytridium lagenaria]
MNEASVEEWLRLNPQATDRILSRLKFEGDPLPRPSVSSGSIDQLRVSATSPDAFEQAAKRHRASFSDTLRTSDLFKEIAKSIYSSFDLSDIVSKVLSIAVTLVHAERCIVFLKDEAADELYSTAWGVGREPQLSASYISFDNNVSPNGVSRSDMLDVVVTRDLSKMGESSEDMFNKWEAGKPQPLQDPGIRFKIGSGIAGYVAKTGVAVNLENAYSDPRFDREFDVKTGCKTQSLLCLPIFAAGNERKILGVASLVNKVSFNHTGQQPDGEHYSFTKFSDEDESIFKDFLFLVGIAINNSFLFQQLREKEQMALAEMKKGQSSFKCCQISLP